MKKLIRLILFACLINSSIFCLAEDIKIYADDVEFQKLKSDGLELSFADKPENAIQAFDKALKIYPDDLQILSEYCICLEMLEQYEKLISTANKALQIAQRKGVCDYIGRFYGSIGKAYKGKKDYKTAIKYFTLAIPNKRTNANVYYHERAVCYGEAGEYDKSIEDFNYLIKFYQEYCDEYNIKTLLDKVIAKQEEKGVENKRVAQAYKYFEAKEFDKAEKEAEIALDFNPDNIKALTLIIRINKNNKNDYQKAIKYAKKLEEMTLLEKYEDDLQMKLLTYSALGSCYKHSGDSDKTAVYSSKISMCKHLFQARDAFMEFNKAKTIKEYQEAYKIEPENYLVLKKLAYALILDRQYDKAKEIIKKGTELAKKEKNHELFAYFCEQVAMIYSDQGDNQKALKFYNLASEQNTDLNKKLNDYYSMAYIEEKNLNYAARKEYLNKCKELIESGATDDIDIPTKIIECEAHLDENSDLNNAERHFNAGTAYFEENKYAEASKEFKISLQYVPQALQVMNALFNSLSAEGKPDDAFEVAWEGYKTSMRDRIFTYAEGFCMGIGNYYCNVKKDYKTAITFFNKALVENPRSAEANCMLGICYMNMGKSADARLHLERAKEYDPSSENIEYYYKKCLGMSE